MRLDKKLSAAQIRLLAHMADGGRLSQFREGTYGEEDGAYIAGGKIINKRTAEILARKGFIKISRNGNMYHYEITAEGRKAVRDEAE